MRHDDPQSSETATYGFRPMLELLPDSSPSGFRCTALPHSTSPTRTWSVPRSSSTSCSTSSPLGSSLASSSFAFVSNTAETMSRIGRPESTASS